MRVLQLTTPAGQQVQLHSKAEMEMVRLKCPTIRHYLNGGLENAALRTGLNRTLAMFQGGPEHARHACSSSADFDQAEFDAQMQLGRLSDAPCYACNQARADGSTTCPVGGCILPTGVMATTPIDLKDWAVCDHKEVGPTVMAKSVAGSEYANKISLIRDKMHVYQDGIHAEIEGPGLQRKILMHLGIQARLKHANEIANMLHVQCAELLDGIEPSPDHICFENGTLNVATKQMEPHSPDNWLMNKIPHPYIEGAECPRFHSFLNSVWEPDEDRDQKIRLIRQWIGYVMTTDTRAHGRI